MPDFTDIEVPPVRRFIAAYDAKCYDCGCEIGHGDEMAKTDQGDYVCELCAILYEEGL